MKINSINTRCYFTVLNSQYSIDVRDMNIYVGFVDFKRLNFNFMSVTKEYVSNSFLFLSIVGGKV